MEMEINSLLINLYCHYFKAPELLRFDYKREYPQHVSFNKVLKNTLERISSQLKIKILLNYHQD